MKFNQDLDWMFKDIIKQGQQSLTDFFVNYSLLPSCKEYLIQGDKELYLNCMMEKYNSCYEQIKNNPR